MKKGECEGCGEKALLEEYDKRDPGYQLANGKTWLCDSCANVTAETGLTDGMKNRLLLKINHKLDRLLQRSR